MYYYKISKFKLVDVFTVTKFGSILTVFVLSSLVFETITKWICLHVVCLPYICAKYRCLNRLIVLIGVLSVCVCVCVCVCMHVPILVAEVVTVSGDGFNIMEAAWSV